MTLITRQYGPTPKGSKLTIEEMDNNLLYLEEIALTSSGPQGPQGSQGPTGSQGSQGPSGSTGSQGTQGSIGPQGAIGSQGAQGSSGAQGAQGSAGNSVTLLGSYPDLASFNLGAGASPGTNIGDSWLLLSDGSLYVWNGSSWFDAGDIKGPQGSQGAVGAQGAQGSIGSQGIQGAQGSAGPQGTQGTQGSQGNVGAQGSQGAVGPQGSQGAAGTQGAQGAQGLQGVQGSQGAQGVQGITGSQGAQGSAGNSVTILGSYADLTSFNLGAGGSPGTNIGDSWILLSDGSLYVWNGSSWFDAGDIQGPQGAQGPQGYQGAIGQQGAVGSQGANGAQGATGSQGAQGTQGATGPQGAQGSIGVQGSQGATGPQGVQGAQGATGAQGAQGAVALTGNTLRVDSVYGNDTNAALNPNSVPFLTISAALAAASSGNNVIINAGTYNETLTIPAGVCVTGASTQAVTIQKLGVTSNTTLITLNANSRLENVTCTLSSAGNYNLTGVDYVTGASINAKIRGSVINVTSTSTNGPTITGILSAGTSATGFSGSDAIARSTINVISSSSGITRGVYLTGANRFAIRESVIYARGTGSNIVGFETNHASSVASIKTTTISGTLYDVNRALGTMFVGGTDLIHNTANGNSFTATQAPASFSFGTINGLATNRRYYMLTGTVPVTQLIDEAKTDPYDPTLALPVPVTQVSLVIAVTLVYQPALPANTSITLKIYKNSSTTPEISLTMLPADGGIKRLDSQSFSLESTDVIRVTLETTGNVGAGGACQAVIGYY